MSYGFKSWNGPNSVAISEDEVTCRLVASVRVARWLVSDGTYVYSVPAFEEARGTIVPTPYLCKFDYIDDQRIANDANMAGEYHRVFAGMAWSANSDRFDNVPPAWLWNEASKELSVTLNSDVLTEWQFNFYHHK